MNLSDKELEFLIRALVDNYADNEGDFDSGDISEPSMSALLIGRLTSLNGRVCHNAYTKARNNKWKESKPLNNGVLFMGAGYHSIIWKNKLHRRIEYAVSTLGGMQQNGGQGTAFDHQAHIEDRETLKSVARDVLEAFGLKPEDLIK